jgi:hypothetical protein
METKERSGKEKAKVERLGLTASREEGRICAVCGKPASQLVDGEPSCEDHLEQVYEHQVEDYTRKHLRNNEWREV